MELSVSRRLSRCAAPEGGLKSGDLYVSPRGDDANDGSLARPFASIERAIRAVSQAGKPLTVCLRAGHYYTQGIKIGAEAAGMTLRAYGDGEAEICGAVRLMSADFALPPDELLRRLRPEARGQVLALDLKKYGLAPEDWGEVCPIGSFGTEKKYDSFENDTNCELFVNDKRMRLARYPSSGFLKIDEVADVGDCHEFPAQNYYYDWNERRNHRGGTYIMDKETAARARFWQEPQKAWVYGFPAFDWADAASPIAALDPEHRSFSPAYVSYYGAYKGGRYYFYNVLEELDAPGEWYLDRQSGMLLLYPPRDISSCDVRLTIARGILIDIRSDSVTLEGLTLSGTRGSAVSVQGDGNALRRLRIKCALDTAVVVRGRSNLVYGCEISEVGRGGIALEGGDLNTLEPGLNTAENNLIRSFAEVYMMYSPAVRLDGTGNRCAHNEMHSSPHMAVLYYGTEHVIEYNYIHDVVQHASDAGAIYGGQSWAWQNCIIRYNVLENIGNAEFKADGIYFDDILSGQRAYGNVLINVAKYGFLVGGGFGNEIRGNVLARAATPICYDARGRDGFLRGGWMRRYVEDYSRGAWSRLREVPYKSEVWRSKYPLIKALSEDFNSPDDPHFPVNPAFSDVSGNIMLDCGEMRIAPDVFRFSSVDNNLQEPNAGVERICAACKALGIALEKIGRY